jgi:hypothetical protein
VTARCRSPKCGAPIRWVKTAGGKAIPLDAEPNQDGNVQVGYIGGEEVAIVLNDAADRAAAQVDGQQLYMPHHATCPDVKAFRR